jgi:hypothetical protein
MKSTHVVIKYNQTGLLDIVTIRSFIAGRYFEVAEVITGVEDKD